MRPREYPPDVVARFWTKVDAPTLTGCWEWKASKRNGYGQFGLRAGHVPNAHIIAYELLVGPVPEGLCLDHLCRNRACVNPRHLEPVTIIENVMRGESPRAKNARKTHCIRGHAFDDENTYVDPKGRRQCRACRARSQVEFNLRHPDYAQRWRERKRAA